MEVPALHATACRCSTLTSRSTYSVLPTWSRGRGGQERAQNAERTELGVEGRKQRQEEHYQGVFLSIPRCKHNGSPGPPTHFHHFAKSPSQLHEHTRAAVGIHSPCHLHQHAVVTKSSNYLPPHSLTRPHEATLTQASRWFPRIT